MSKAQIFSEHVFKGSKESSNGLVRVSNHIINSSVESLELIGLSPPCNFAVIGLGSIAKGEATPYSDLEYAFIVEHDSEFFKQLAIESYFRIGNLGETPLKGFAIEELKRNYDKDTKAGYRVGELHAYQQILGNDITVGYRIDGITMWSGNVPTAPANHLTLATNKPLYHMRKQ